MKNFIVLALLLASSNSFATIFSGKVQLFSGLTVETMSEYKYYALVSGNKKIMLPGYLDTKVLYENKTIVTADATLLRTFCTDMSAACSSGFLIDIKSLNFKNDMQVTSYLKKYTGDIQEHESLIHGKKHYLLITEENSGIDLPHFISDKAALFHSSSTKIEFSLEAYVSMRMCPRMDMGPCPNVIRKLKEFNLTF